MNVGRFTALGLCGGTVAAATAIRPKTQNGEHAANKISTAVGLGTLAATPYLVKQAVKANPALANKAIQYTGAGIEKAAEYVAKYGKKAAQSATGKKAVGFLSKVFDKVKSTKIGSKVINTIKSGISKIASNSTVKNIATKVADAAKNFMKAPTATKGKYALIAAGVGLLAYAGYKTITGFFKKEGAIDQKYKDMEVMDKMLA